MGQRVARTPFLRSLDEFRLLAAPLDERGPMSSVFVNLSCCPTHSTHSLFPFSLPPLNFLPSLLSHSFPPPLLSLSLALCPLSFTPPLCSLPPHRRQKRCRKKNSSKCHAEGHSIPHRRCHVVHFFSLKLRPVSLMASVRRCRPLGPLRGIPSVGAGRPEPTTAMLQRVTGRSEVWEAREGRMVGGGNGRRERERETIALCNFFTFVLIHLYACHKFLSANNLLIRFNLPISLSCVCICTYTYRHSNVYV